MVGGEADGRKTRSDATILRRTGISRIERTVALTVTPAVCSPSRPQSVERAPG